MKLRLMIYVGIVLITTLIFSLRSVAEAGQTPTASPSQMEIKINEFMASNSTVLEDPDERNEFPDWIELYNPASAAVSLDGLYLIEGDLADPVRFAISDGLTIPARGFIVFYADDDPSQGKLHTNFRLNKEGGQLGLYGDLNAVQAIDALVYAAQTTDRSEGRDPDGGPTWRQYDRPTPGRTNILLPPLIAEVQHMPELPKLTDTVRVTARISDDGEIVEASLVYSLTSVSSDTATAPAVSVPMTVVSGNLYAAQIPAQSNGAMVHYYITARDDQGQVTPNLDQVRLHYYRYPVGYVKPPLFVNELMAENSLVLEDPDDPGNYPDWFEIYNAGTSSVSLDGLFLTDKMDNPSKFAITDGLSIPAGGYLVFYADEQQNQGVLHTNFKLEKNGETVAIFGAEGSVEIDRVDFPGLYENVAYGRYPDGSDRQLQMLVCPTPGKTNVPCDQKAYLPAISGLNIPPLQ